MTPSKTLSRDETTSLFQALATRVEEFQEEAPKNFGRAIDPILYLGTDSKLTIFFPRQYGSLDVCARQTFYGSVKRICEEVFSKCEISMSPYSSLDYTPFQASISPYSKKTESVIRVNGLVVRFPQG